MINENIAKGKWAQLKGQIQKTWGRLTDDELDQAQGSIDKLAGLVQQRYGEAQESVRERINKFIADSGSDESAEAPSSMAKGSFKDTVKETVKRKVDAAQDAVAAAKDKWNERH